MTNITVEKIDNIITKIEENKNKELNDREVRKLLNEIDDELGEIEENAEKKQKKVVDKKMEGLRNAIDKSRKEKALSKDIKNGLVELKNEIEELEKPTILITEHRAENEMINFYKKEIEELKVKLEKAEKERDEYKNKFEAKDREAWELKNKKKDFGEIAGQAEGYLVTAATTGVDLGHHALPVIGDAVGGLIGVGVGGIGALIHSGSYTADQVKELLEKYGEGLKETAEKGMDLTDEARKGLKEFSENVLGIAADVHKDNLHVVADNVEKARQGAENLIGKGMDNVTSSFNLWLKESSDTLQKIVGTKAQFKLGLLNVELGDRKGEVLGATVEGKEEIIKNLREELERVEQALEKKDERIKELEKLQVNQHAEQREDNKNMLDKLFGVVEVVAKSRDTSRAPSPTPPPYVKNPQ